MWAHVPSWHTLAKIWIQNEISFEKSLLRTLWSVPDGPNFTALVTVSKESVFTENREFCAYVKRISRVSRNVLLLVRTPCYL